MNSGTVGLLDLTRSLTPFSSIFYSWDFGKGPKKASELGWGRGWAGAGKDPPGEECSESRNSMAGVGLRRRI